MLLLREISAPASVVTAHEEEEEEEELSWDEELVGTTPGRFQQRTGRRGHERGII